MSLLHGARQTPAVQFARLQRHHRMKTRSRSAARWHPNPLARVARSIEECPHLRTARRGGGNPPPALLGQATWGSGPRLRAATLATEHWASIGSCRDVSAPTAQLHDRPNPLPDHSSTPARRSPTSLRNRPACDASAQGVDQVCTTALAIWSKGRRGPRRRRNTRQVAGFHARRASKARAFEGNPGGIELRQGSGPRVAESHLWCGRQRPTEPVHPAVETAQEREAFHATKPSWRSRANSRSFEFEDAKRLEPKSRRPAPLKSMV